MAIINHKYKFIFIKTRKTAGTSLEIALSKFCDSNDIIAIIKPEDEKIRKKLGYQGPSNNLHRIRKFISFKMITHNTKAFIKTIPFSKKIFNYVDPPKFDFKFPFIDTRQKFTEHNNFADLKKKINSNIFESYFKFTIIRSPYDAMVSHYYWQLNKNEFSLEKTFYDFVIQECEKYFRSMYDILFINDKLYFDKIIYYENLEKNLTSLSERLKLPENIYDIFKNIQAKSHTRKSKNLDIVDKKSEALIYKIAKRFFDEFKYGRIYK